MPTDPTPLTEADRAQMHDEVFTNEVDLFWLTRQGRTLFEAVGIVSDCCDDRIGYIEVREVKGRVERSGSELHFSQDEHGDVDAWRIEVADA